MKFANNMPNGCLDQISTCKSLNRTSPEDFAICTQAGNMCRDNVGTLPPPFPILSTISVHLSNPLKNPPTTPSATAAPTTSGTPPTTPHPPPTSTTTSNAKT